MCHLCTSVSSGGAPVSSGGGGVACVARARARSTLCDTRTHLHRAPPNHLYASRAKLEFNDGAAAAGGRLSARATGCLRATNLRRPRDKRYAQRVVYYSLGSQLDSLGCSISAGEPNSYCTIFPACKRFLAAAAAAKRMQIQAEAGRRAVIVAAERSAALLFRSPANRLASS